MSRAVPTKGLSTFRLSELKTHLAPTCLVSLLLRNDCSISLAAPRASPAARAMVSQPHRQLDHTLPSMKRGTHRGFENDLAAPVVFLISALAQQDVLKVLLHESCDLTVRGMDR